MKNRISPLIQIQHNNIITKSRQLQINRINKVPATAKKTNKKSVSLTKRYGFCKCMFYFLNSKYLLLKTFAINYWGLCCWRCCKNFVYFFIISFLSELEH